MSQVKWCLPVRQEGKRPKHIKKIHFGLLNYLPEIDAEDTEQTIASFRMMKDDLYCLARKLYNIVYLVNLF